MTINYIDFWNPFIFGLITDTFWWGLLLGALGYWLFRSIKR